MQLFHGLNTIDFARRVIDSTADRAGRLPFAELTRRFFNLRQEIFS
jgi:hypothetical protein